MSNSGTRSDASLGLAFALPLAVLALAADQGSKWAILTLVMDPPRVIEVMPFFNLTLGFNRGITFGLLGGGSTGPWPLTAAALVAIAGLAVWAWRARCRIEAAAIGAVVGGAIGNVADRVRQGAVTDFLDLHAFGWHWPTFNVADVAIVCGVGTLLLRSWRGDSRTAVSGSAVAPDRAADCSRDA